MDSIEALVEREEWDDALIASAELQTRLDPILQSSLAETPEVADLRDRLEDAAGRITSAFRDRQRASVAAPTPAPAPAQTLNIETLIRQRCTAQWPSDFRMQDYCGNQQREAVNKLGRGAPSDVPNEVFQTIRTQCGQQWGDDFRMRAYCEDQQFQAYRRVR